jgi:hypothetical protein
LVGIDWQAVRASPFAEPIEAELWGDLGFPDVPCLHAVRQIIVSSPDMLALASGTFPAAAVRDQMAKKSFKPMTYRGIDMWFASEKGALSVARMNDQFMMLGEPKTLEIAVDRSLGDSKNYSPLLARAAKLAQKDLWVVSSQLPDDLANRFVPLDTEAQSFEGWVSVRGGLRIRRAGRHDVNEGMQRFIALNAENRRADNLLRLGVHQHLHETVGFAAFARAADPRHRHGRDQGIAAGRAHLGFGKTDSREWRIDKHRIRHDAGIGRARTTR